MDSQTFLFASRMNEEKSAENILPSLLTDIVEREGESQTKMTGCGESE